MIAIQQINVDGNMVAYHSRLSSNAQGSLLFIHGSGGDHHKWDGIMEHLPQGFSGVAVDLPGHAASAGPLLKNIDEAAGLIAKLPGLLNLPRPIYMAGHSMGAAIAISIALDYSANADGLILIGGGARLKVLPAVLEALQAGQKDSGFFRLGFAPDTPATIIEAELSACQRVPAEVFYNDFSACDHFDRINDITDIKVPVLLIAGENDKLAPLKYSQFLHDHIQESSLAIIPQAGHYVMLEKALEVSRAIEQFVSRY